MKNNIVSYQYPDLTQPDPKDVENARLIGEIISLQAENRRLWVMLNRLNETIGAANDALDVALTNMKGE